MRLTRFRRSIGSAIAVALATALVALPGAAAEPRPSGLPLLHVSGTLGLPCVYVEVDTVGNVTVTQRRNGVVIASKTVPAVSSQTEPCLKPLKPGDELTMERGDVSVVVTVPSLSASVNRATDVVSGTFPDSLDAVITVQQRVDSVVTPRFFYRAVSTVDGVWSVDASDAFDIRPGDPVNAVKTGADQWKVLLSARTAYVRVGSSRISGTGPIGGTVAVTVRAKGAIRGTVKRAVRLAPTVEAGTFAGTLRKDGAAVKVKAGDRVTVAGLAGSRTVPARSMQVFPASDSVVATCPGPGEFVLTVNGVPVAYQPILPDGSVQIGGLTLATGDTVTLRCALETGFGTVETAKVR